MICAFLQTKKLDAPTIFDIVCHKSDQVAPFGAEWSGEAAGSLLLLLLKH